MSLWLPLAPSSPARTEPSGAQLTSGSLLVGAAAMGCTAHDGCRRLDAYAGLLKSPLSPSSSACVVPSRHPALCRLRPRRGCRRPGPSCSFDGSKSCSGCCLTRFISRGCTCVNLDSTSRNAVLGWRSRASQGFLQGVGERWASGWVHHPPQNYDGLTGKSDSWAARCALESSSFGECSCCRLPESNRGVFSL